MKIVRDRDKVEILERILRDLTGATEIRWDSVHIWKGQINGYVQLVGADPDDVKLGGYDNGLELGYDSEPYDDEMLGKKVKSSRIIVDVWIGPDPWKRVEELESQLKEKKAKPE